MCEIRYRDLYSDKDKIVVYTKEEMEQVDLAYAITTHLYQGSGYNTVIGIIDNTHFMLLDNCMLYTLLTRAKKRALLLAEPSAFQKCIRTNHNTSRQTWIKDF
jgi:exodeoxyribonuclease V alpha subunit